MRNCSEGGGMIDFSRMTAGLRLRSLREELGLNMRDVETATESLSRKYGSDDFLIPIGRLSEIETKNMVPSIYRLYALAVVYRRDVKELMSWYGLDLGAYVADI